ncbi:hypothetical protein J6590_047712 [Homalodisca vitripennis]|nr:hypothetical protein J6590_047712 [Homalodisca vitripennis]
METKVTAGRPSCRGLTVSAHWGAKVAKSSSTEKAYEDRYYPPRLGHMTRVSICSLVDKRNLSY